MIRMSDVVVVGMKAEGEDSDWMYRGEERRGEERRGDTH